ncbi:DUF2889 domain-containing protein [Paraburkholderia aspalathi]|jgi:hypothetical protein|uniref:DUF2889 domain-containing protein n=1 Tax=Paraburkholderia aspalathi TaxID=1324617 RepID=A0A1I7DCH9_9BURK|nr:DUF2889 domain-containing protein [Paraburkholderia aspalathi]SFU09315.1 Protein of unknown function [Paraburkholderia aspalathi]
MTETDETMTREELHFRRIDMRGWKRADGLFEIEGRVTDRKPHEFTSPGGTKVVPAGAPIHDMTVKLVIDQEMCVVDVSATTHSAPYADCVSATGTLQVLKGLRIAGGWSREVRNRLGGAQSCTHLMEILTPMATAAYQSLTMARLGRPDSLDSNGKPLKVDSCFAYASNRGVVMRRWPAYYTGGKSTESD